MKTLAGSLAALALVAAREGQWSDAARLIAQASVAHDSEEFLECELSDNFQASCLVNSVSGTTDLSDSVSALSAALAINAEEEQVASMYGDDEIISLNNADEIEDEEEQSVSSSSIISLRFD